MEKDVLKSWRELNQFIRTATENQCNELLDKEKSTLNRRLFIRRIHSRLNKVRADRERRELDI